MRGILKLLLGFVSGVSVLFVIVFGTIRFLDLGDGKTVPLEPLLSMAAIGFVAFVISRLYDQILLKLNPHDTILILK